MIFSGPLSRYSRVYTPENRERGKIYLDRCEVGTGFFTLATCPSA
jgi:hypothetical protein